jgi:hypothetical protein
MNKPLSPDERLAIYSAGGRQEPEKSKALPSRYYGRDPLDNFEYPTERLRKEEARRQQRAAKKGKKR